MSVRIPLIRFRYGKRPFPKDIARMNVVKTQNFQNSSGFRNSKNSSSVGETKMAHNSFKNETQSSSSVSKQDYFGGEKRMAFIPPGITEIAMPALSPTMDFGTILEWKVKEGDKVVPGDVFCTVDTDKATLEFENQLEGYIAKILVPGGTKDVKLGTVVALLADKEQDIANAKDYVPRSSESFEEKAEEMTTKDDTPQAPTTSNQEKSTKVIHNDQEKRPASQVTVDVGSDYTDISVSNVRKVIAKRLLQSKTSIPHYYLTVECQMDELMGVRSKLNKEGEKNGFKLSVNDFIIKAVAIALKKVPQVNASWTNNAIRKYQSSDISVAVQTDNGLITPIISQAEKKGLAEISNQVKSLAKKAREGSLQPSEFQGGSFTISNLGMFGVNEFAAIVNPPQSCILAVGTAEEKIVPNEGCDSKQNPFKVVTTMNVTLSCDHRVVDGAVGAQWLQEFKKVIENPLSLIV